MKIKVIGLNGTETIFTTGSAASVDVSARLAHLTYSDPAGLGVTAINPATGVEAPDPFFTMSPDREEVVLNLLSAPRTVEKRAPAAEVVVAAPPPPKEKKKKAKTPPGEDKPTPTPTKKRKHDKVEADRVVVPTPSAQAAAGTAPPPPKKRKYTDEQKAKMAETKRKNKEEKAAAAFEEGEIAPDAGE